jgi:2-polyprenyl-6-methoxyphenol hydroxylase-like FAD-dependent oxidoreductase
MVARVTEFPRRTDVLVVGAGPTGLSLACRLARRGIDHVVIDHAPPGANLSSGAVVHARTLEVLEAIEVSTPLVRRGVAIPHFTLREGDDKLLAVDFSELPTRYPFALMLPQSAAEEIFLEQLNHYGSSVLRPVTAVGLQQDAESVTVELWDGSARSGSPSRQSIVARYVVACDGVRSQIRSALEMPFIGSAPAVSFLVADVHMQWSLSPTEVQLFFSEDGLLVVAPLPDEQHRILAMVGQGDAPPGRDDVQELLSTRGPRASAAIVRDVVWSARYLVQDQVATRYRAGRVFLAGDAAHLHSPAAGQGMNAGIQDALLLADQLSDVISGRADVSVLDRYDRERRPVAEAVLRTTQRLARMATMRGGMAPKIRNQSLRFVSKLPALRRRLAHRLSGLDAAMATAGGRTSENKVWHVATLVLVALLLGTTFAHAALELPQRMRAEGVQWLTLQRSIYTFFAYARGPIEGAALLASSLWVVKMLRQRRSYAIAAAAAACLLLAFAVWVALIQPVNAEIATLGAGVMPFRWAALRSQWGCSHSIRFVLHCCGFVLLASARP